MKKISLYLSLLFLVTSCSPALSDSSVIESESVSTTESISSSEVESGGSSAEMEEKEYVDLFTTKVKEINPSSTEPHIEIDKVEYNPGDSISVSSVNCKNKDWIGLYPYNGYPGDMDAIVWQYVDKSAPITLKATLHKTETNYKLYLCENDGYTVLDCKDITITNTGKDYKVKEASCSYDGNSLSISITPSISKLLTYELYWAKDGVRLDDYTYFASFKKASSSAFTYELDSHLIMPEKANQIEVRVFTGVSTSTFIDVNADAMKIHSNFLYSFNVYSDIHVQNYTLTPSRVSHLQSALNDAYNLGKNNKAFFSVGDQTDTGSKSDYTCVMGLFNTYKKAANVPIYLALGNHEYMYNSNTDFNDQVELFKKYAETDGVFYTIEMEGSTCIFMGSDTMSTAGGMNSERVTWLKEQLDNANKDKPTFVFLHQPLIDTTAGSYGDQNWFGITNVGNRLKELLANYKNTYLFTGHTHWEMESKNNVMISTTGTSYFNCASVGYLWNDDNTGEPGSEGYFVDVYDDCLVVRGREFTKHKWLAYAQYRVPYSK